MNELIISTYIQILQEGLVVNDRQEAAARLLFNSITSQPDSRVMTDLNPKKISRLINRKDPVPDDFKKAVLRKTIQSGVKEYFESTIIPDLNPITRYDMLERLRKVIEQDNVIAARQKKAFYDLYDKDDLCGFLAETFFYALQRNNKTEPDTVSPQDTPLLAEVNWECPLSQIKLVDNIDGVPWSRYAITKIFPDGLSPEQSCAFEAIYARPADLDSPNNLIALSRDEAEKYSIAPSTEQYRRLHDIKTQAVRRMKAQADVNRITLEDDIRNVVTAFKKIEQVDNLPALDYTALRVGEKVSDRLLQVDIRDKVLQYYYFIEKTFSDETDDFDVIAAAVKDSSQRLENSGLSQDDVIEQLTEWIRNQVQLGTEFKLACRIVVCFFIQNCEVFHRCDFQAR